MKNDLNVNLTKNMKFPLKAVQIFCPCSIQKVTSFFLKCSPNKRKRNNQNYKAPCTKLFPFFLCERENTTI